HHQAVIARDQFAPHRDPPGLLASLELPQVHRAGGRRTDTDALVRKQVFGGLGHATALEVGGGAHGDEAERIRQAYVHHVALEELFEPDAGVVALRHDVDEAVVDVHFHLHLRMLREKTWQHRGDDEGHG